MGLTIFIVIVLIIAIIVSAFNLLAGAIVNLSLATFVLFYGLDAYATEGWTMTILNFPVTKKAFLIFMAVWYFFAVIELISALIKIRRKRKKR